MCLTTINLKLEPCTEGYVVRDFDKRTNRLRSPYQGRFIRQCRRRWLNEYEYRLESDASTIKAEDGTLYPAGWHVFHNFADARRFMGTPRVQCVARVKVREPLAVGFQQVNLSLYSITVCKYIKIEETYDALQVVC